MPTAFKAQQRTRVARPLVMRRPSILDARPQDDLWIQRCRNEPCLVLYIQAQPVAVFSALALDLESLNSRLFELGRRGPREFF